MTKQKKRILIILIALLVIALLFASAIKKRQAEEKTEEPAQEVVAIDADIISYGNWTPEGNREVLVTVESDAEVDIVSELSGTIGNIYVKPGQQVTRGQHLAVFNQTFDQTQVAYQNALTARDAATAAAENSVTNAEISLQTVQRNLNQTIETENQSILQVFENLKTQTQNTESSFQTALDLIDQWVGYSYQYRFSNDDRGALENRDRIGFNNLHNKTGNLIRTLEGLTSAPGFGAAGSDVLAYARERVNYANTLQSALVDFENLAQRALISDTFTDTDQDTLLTSIRTQKTSINTELLTLNSTLESARTSNERKDAAILTAENQVKNAQSSLDLARANADSQIKTAQNSLNAAYASKSDLIIRAPFAGTISEKFVNVGQQVSPNQQVFKIINPDSSQKAVAFLTTRELSRLKSQDMIQLQVGAQDIELEQGDISARLDSNTQKMRVEFVLPSDLEQAILVGQIGKLFIDTDQSLKNIIPISAVAFEPDGAEVLVVEKKGETKRQKIIIDALESDGITVRSGLYEGDQIIQYRNRVYAGQKVNISEIKIADKQDHNTEENGE